MCLCVVIVFIILLILITFAQISLAPVYLGVNQRTLDLLLDFFNRSTPGEDEDLVSDIPSPPMYFDRFQVGFN